jgi:kynureninase
MEFQTDRSFAEELDAADPLLPFRDRFFIPDPSMIYMDGNSLGRLPAGSITSLDKVIRYNWGDRLIRSWNESWYSKSTDLGDRIGKLLGAEPGEVILSDSTSVNLYKLSWAAIHFQQGKDAILTDDINFPSDLYILQGLVSHHPPWKVNMAHSADGLTVGMDNLKNAASQGTGLVCLSHVAYKSSFMYDMKEVTHLAHDKDALILWDLSHSAGVVPIDLKASQVDMAIGCTYKYLNGGPGAPAFLYVRKDLQEQLRSPVQGWFGARDPFDFSTTYSPAEGIRKFLTGTPPILSMSALEEALVMIREAGIDRIRRKSENQSEYMVKLIKHWLLTLECKLGSPPEVKERGSHISIRHKHAYRINQAMIHPPEGIPVIIPDFREPDNIRLGIAPLYTSYREIFDTISRIRDILSQKTYLDHSIDRKGVT